MTALDINLCLNFGFDLHLHLTYRNVDHTQSIGDSISISLKLAEYSPFYCIPIAVNECQPRAYLRLNGLRMSKLSV